MKCNECSCVLEEFEIAEYEIFKKMIPNSTQEPMCNECVNSLLGFDEE